MPYKIFLSSPADVEPERDVFERVVDQINNEHQDGAPFELVRWEHQYYTAQSTFQTQIAQPSDCDLVVCIFWKRLGSDLPDHYARPDGSVPTGTEYEFEEALEAAARSEEKLPDVVVYRKTAEVSFSEANLEYEKAQRDRFLQFWQRWFRNEKGHFVAGFQSFADAAGFSPLAEAHLRQWLHNRTDTVSWTSGSPYRGLAPFDVKHAPIFFGRARETERARARLLANCLAGERFLLILGASGSGKSSLARAGLIARLAEVGGLSEIATHLRWTITTPMTIQGDWSTALASALFEAGALGDELAASDFDTPALLGGLLERGGPESVAPVRKALERAATGDDEPDATTVPGPAALLILVDQMEEVFAWPAETAAAFLDTLARLCLEGTAPVLVVGTMRSDFQHRIGDIPALERLVGKLELRGPDEAERTLELALPSAADLREMIVGPARAAGLSFEVSDDHRRDLGALLEHEASPDALPAVQFLLSQLYERREERLLTLAGYDSLGGSGGVMATRGEEILKALGGEALEAFPRVARALVTRTGADATTTALTVAESSFGEGNAAARLVNALKQASLLRSDRAMVRIAHESLIAGWTRLRELTERDRALFESREHLLPYFRRYGEAGSAERRAHLLTGFQLAEGRQLVQSWGEEVLADTDPGLPQFIAASSARETWKRRRNLLVGWAMSVVFAALSFQMYTFWQESEVAKDNEAQARGRAEDARKLEEAARREAESALKVVQSQNALRDGEVMRGAELALQALALVRSESTRSAALTALMEVSPHLQSSFPAGRDVLAWVDPETIAVTGRDTTVRVRRLPRDGDATTEGLPLTIGGDALVRFVGRVHEDTIVLVLDDGTIRRARREPGEGWRLDVSANPTGLFRSGAAHTIAAGATAGGVSIAFADIDGTAIWRCADDADPARCVSTVIGPPDAELVALSADGRWLAVAHGFPPSALAVYDLSSDGSAPAAEATLDGEITSLAWSAARDRLAVGIRYDVDGAKAQLVLLDATSLAEGLSPIGEAEPVSARALATIAWSPVEAALAFACGEYEICIRRFDPAGARPVEHRLFGHENLLARLAWSPDGTRLASIDDDERLFLWRLEPDRRVLSVLETDGASELRSVAVDPRRGRIAAGDRHGDVWLWLSAEPWSAPRRLQTPEGVRAPAASLAFAPDGALAVAHEDHGIALRGPGGETIERYETIAGEVNRLAWIDGGLRVAAPARPRALTLVPRSDAAVTLVDPELDMDPRGVAALPETGGFVASFTDGSLWRWSESGERSSAPLVSAADAGTGARGGMSLAVGPNGRRIAVSRSDDRLKIYDLSARTETIELRLHNRSTVTVAFSPSGSRFAALGADARLYVWNMEGGSASPLFSVLATPARSRAAQSASNERPVWWLAWLDDDRIVLPTVAGNAQVLDVTQSSWLARARALGVSADDARVDAPSATAGR